VITLTADKRVLVAEINNDSLRAAQGSMVAFEGSVEFVGAKMGGGDGFRAALKRSVAGESLDLMEARGTGRVFFAEDALDVTVLDVGGSRLTLESDHILAVTPGLRLDVQFAGLRGMTSGQGLATTTVDGQGQIAVKSDGPIFGLEASPGRTSSSTPTPTSAPTATCRCRWSPGCRGSPSSARAPANRSRCGSPATAWSTSSPRSAESCCSNRSTTR